MKKRTFLGVLILSIVWITSFSQTVIFEPTGNPADFKVKSCLHSVSYAGLWGQDVLTVDEFLLTAKRLGYDGVILMAKRPHVSPLDYDKEARAKLKKRIADLGLTLVALAGYNDFTAGMEYNPGGAPQAEIQGAYLGMVAELANDLGTKMVRIFTGNKREGVAYDKQYATIVEGITIAAKEAQKYGVTLFVQNHHNIAFNYNDLYAMLKEINLPNVKAGWDPGQLLRAPDSPEEIRQSILKMKPYIVNTISDHGIYKAIDKKDNARIAAYDAFYNALKEIGYQGYLVYEMCGKIEGGGSINNLDAFARRFHTYIRKFR